MEILSIRSASGSLFYDPYETGIAHVRYNHLIIKGLPELSSEVSEAAPWSAHTDLPGRPKICFPPTKGTLYEFARLYAAAQQSGETERKGAIQR